VDLASEYQPVPDVEFEAIAYFFIIILVCIPSFILILKKYGDCNAHNKARLRQLRKIKLKN
jgi:hypothetical protein